MWFDRFQITEDAPLSEAEARWADEFLALRGTGYEEAAHALGLLIGLPFADSPHLGAMRNDPVQVRGRAFVVSRELLEFARNQTPLVMLLEDLHWADRASWEYIAHAILEDSTGEEAANGLFILATARPEWNPPDALLNHPDYLRIDLAPLSDAASRDLAAELLKRVESVPDSVLRSIVERSEGMPYYAEEMVNWFLDSGIIDRSREPWRFVSPRFDESPLPATLQHLLFTRLSALSETERATLQRGSVFGRNFWTGGLDALGARAGADVLGHLQPRGFVEAQPDSSFAGETEWSFHHNLLRDVTYESVLKRERPALHRAAGTWLEEQARQAERLDEFAGLLGEHAERAGAANAAADWYLRAGERAKEQGAPLEARRFFDRVMDLLPPTERELRWRALLGLNSVLSVLGEDEAQRASIPLLLELAKEMDDSRLAAALYRSSLYMEKTGDMRAALTQYQAALEAARRAGDPQIEIKILASQAICQNRLGDPNGAATAQQAIALSSRADESTAAHALSNVAVYYVEAGDLSRAAQLHAEQAAINHRLGDRGAEANGLLNLGYDYALLGLYSSARAALEQALPMVRAIGARREQAYAMLNLGLVHWRCGEGLAARQVLEQARGELLAVDDAFGHAASLSYLGLVLEQLDDTAAASRLFTEAYHLFTAMGVGGYAADVLADLARCALAQGDLGEAYRKAAAVWEYLSRHAAQGMEFPVWAYQTCADVFAALGESEKSRAALDKGYGELMVRAEKISDPGWRQSFLENVPEHRAIRETWERLSRQPHSPLRD
jgi:predicted ATPase